MNSVKLYSQYDIRNATKKRSGETKIGDRISVFTNDWISDLTKLQSKFVILGIPEDIGVRANFGRSGAHSAFRPALESFLTQQSNVFFDGANISVLGEVYVDDLMEKAAQLQKKSKLEIEQLQVLTSEIDERVQWVISHIVKNGKIPVVIGGGHNNAYGNLKGASKALNKKVNVINCDPHLDFRPLEGRHSGNGFSYAFSEGYVNKYSVFAMHEQYNNASALEQFFKQQQFLMFTSYESVFVREESTFENALARNISFVKEEDCGIEIDLDAITNVPSSAKTSSGISPVQARRYIHECGSKLKPLYLHIAEGAPVLSHIKADNKTGKLIAYLVTDFIKAVDSANR